MFLTLPPSLPPPLMSVGSPTEHDRQADWLDRPPRGSTEVIVTWTCVHVVSEVTEVSLTLQHRKLDKKTGHNTCQGQFEDSLRTVRDTRFLVPADRCRVMAVNCS